MAKSEEVNNFPSFLWFPIYKSSLYLYKIPSESANYNSHGVHKFKIASRQRHQRSEFVCLFKFDPRPSRRVGFTKKLRFGDRVRVANMF